MNKTYKMKESDKKYFVGLSMIPGLGSRSLIKLLEYFGSAEKSWVASEKEINQLGLKNSLKKSIISNRKKIDLNREYNKIINDNIKLLTIDDFQYPSLLKEIYDPPILIYYKGNINWKESIFFGVVGTIKLTSYGKRAIEEIVSGLTQKGLVIVSGMARGGDTVAHKVAINNGGNTVAVLGSGLNHIYPPENKKLSQQITEHGALISEFPPSTEPRRQHFPMRNRIISGLSLGLLVVEASEKSGTLITANCALEQNREVFALPGSIFNPYSRGPAKLIKMGAKLVSDIEDILEELQVDSLLKSKEAEAILPDSKEEERILSVLNLRDYVMIDELIRQFKITSSEVMAILTMMEMKGKIQNLGKGKYSRK